MAPIKKNTKVAAKKPAAVKPKPVAKAKKPPIRPPEMVKSVPVLQKKIKEDSKPVNSKANFSGKDLEFFKKIILEKKKEILEELETLRETMMDSQTGEYVSENSTYSTHMEQGTDAMEREKMFLFASREGKFLNYLEDALKRIDKGDYGH